MSTLVQDPLDVTPGRRPGSVRRTSHVDMIFEGPELVLRGAARDLLTNTRGQVSTIGNANVDARLDAARLLQTIATSPAAATGSLLGLPVGRGFRAAVENAVPDHASGSTPLYLLLDELPVAALISGYALLYSGRLPGGDRQPAMQENICAGWRSDGTMMSAVHRGDGVPVPLGPAAAPIETPTDPTSWHTIGELTAGAMRRRRLVEIRPGVEPSVWAMFRDTHVATGGDETVLHEYVVEATINRESHSFTACRATPKVLPWPECSDAEASASRLVGLPLDGIRGYVRSDLNGISTCTHLNDLLRSLGDIPALLAKMDEAPTQTNEKEQR